jgi:hypothetical protein
MLGTVLYAKLPISNRRFDGSMDQRARAAVVDEFTKPSKVPKILLISLKAGGVGLNLLVACDSSRCVTEADTFPLSFAAAQHNGESYVSLFF